MRVLSGILILAVASIGCVRFGNERSGRAARVDFVSPSGAMTYVATSLRVELEVSGLEPSDRVRLLLDGTLLSDLTSPYIFQWDTSDLTGVHELVGIVRRDGQTVAQTPTRHITIDRVRPQAVSIQPDDACLTRESLSIVFSEPLSPDSVGPNSVVVVGSLSGPVASSTVLDFDRLLVQPVLSRGAETLELFISDQLTDRAGNRVDDAFPLQISIGAFQNTPKPIPGASGLTRIYGLDYNNGGEPFLLGRGDQGVQLLHRFQDEWRFLGVGPIAPGANTSGGGVKVASNGTPFFAWDDNAASGWSVNVGYWNDYDYFYSQVAPDQYLLPDGLAISANDEVFVATHHWNLLEVSVYRLSAILPLEWESLGAPIPVLGGPSAMTLASDGNPILVTPENAGFVARKWNGSNWETMGSPFGITGGDAPYYPKICLQDGAPLVAYDAGAAYGEARVARFDGVDWTDVGAPMRDAWGLRGNDPWILCLAGGPLVISQAYDADPFHAGTFAAQLVDETWAPVGCNQSTSSQTLNVVNAMATRHDGTVGVLFDLLELRDDGTLMVPRLKESSPGDLPGLD